MKNEKNYDALRVIRICQRIRRQVVDDGVLTPRITKAASINATRLWNAIDHVNAYNDPEGLWDIMEIMLPWAYVNGRFQFEYWNDLVPVSS